METDYTYKSLRNTSFLFCIFPGRAREIIFLAQSPMPSPPSSIHPLGLYSITTVRHTILYTLIQASPFFDFFFFFSSRHDSSLDRDDEDDSPPKSKWIDKLEFKFLFKHKYTQFCCYTVLQFFFPSSLPLRVEGEIGEIFYLQIFGIKSYLHPPSPGPKFNLIPNFCPAIPFSAVHIPSSSTSLSIGK